MKRFIEKHEKKIYLAIIVLAVILICVLCGQKQGFFEDEYYSYTLSNGPGMQIVFEKGYYYSPASTPYIHSMNASDQYGIKQVWINQINDVHPPLYYLLFHLLSLISSKSAETLNLLPPVVINCLFYVGMLIVAVKLMNEFIEDIFVRVLTFIFLAFCPAVLSITVLFRMYVMSMFFALWFSELILQDHLDMRLIFICLLGGILTHYYFIIYAGLLSLFYLISLFHRKQFIYIRQFVITGFLSCVSSVMVFPWLLKHLFFGYRGTQSVSNLIDRSLSFYFLQLRGYLGIMNHEIFGGGLPLLLIFGVFAIWAHRHKDHYNLKKSGLLLATSFTYFLFIARVSISINSRYMCLIYFPILLAIAMITDPVLMKCHRSFRTGFGGLLIGIMIFSWVQEPWEYLRQDKTDLYIAASGHMSQDCIVFYDDTWKLVSTYGEVQHYRGVQFFDYVDAQYVIDDLCQRIENGDTVLLVMAGEDQKTDILIEEMKDNGLWPEFLYRDGIAPTFELKTHSSQ